MHSSQAIEAHRSIEGASITFIHNNAYTPTELGECFERNSEGILKNMVHTHDHPHPTSHSPNTCYLARQHYCHRPTLWCFVSRAVSYPP